MMRGLAVLTLLLLQEGDRVAPLSRDLESPDLRKIYHAVAGLASLGEAALPAIDARLREAKGRPRDYLQLAADEIRASGLLNSVPRAKRVTMKSADRNVIELLGDLRNRTGVALALENLMGDEKLPEIPVDIQDATTLEAFDAICKVGNVSILMENGQFMLYPGDYQDVPRFFYDHYFFRLAKFKLMKAADFRRPAVQTFTLEMEMLWDPVAAPCRFSLPVLFEASDDKGRNLLPPPPAPRKKDEPVDPEELGPSAELKLLPPSSGAEKIAVLRGFVPLALPKARVSVTFGGPPAEPAEGVRKTGDFSVKLAKIEAALYRVTFEIGAGAMKPDDLAKLPYQATVTLKGGEPTRCFIQASAKKDGAEVIVAFQPLHVKEVLVQQGDDRPAPPPVLEKIELSIVTAVQDRRIPFEFRDVKIK